MYTKLNSNNEILFYRLSSEALDNKTKKNIKNMINNWNDIQFYLEKINEVALYLEKNKNFEGTEFMILIKEIIESYKKIKNINSFIKVASELFR